MILGLISMEISPWNLGSLLTISVKYVKLRLKFLMSI